jgi:hypothetical protein
MYYLKNNSIEKRIETWRIVIPLRNNQGKEFDKEVIDDIKNRIMDYFSGMTIINAVGSWKNGKKIYKDQNIVLLIDVPCKDSSTTSEFFLNLKKQLMEDLSQEKIYVTKESEKSELLTINEFLQELGFEIPSDQSQSFTQDNIEKLVNQSEIIKNRFSYKTLSLRRNKKLKNIEWEREILGIKIKTTIPDVFPNNAEFIGVDNLEICFREQMRGKIFVVVGDYEYQSYILDKEKRVYIVGGPDKFKEYDEKGKEPLYGPHPWHGLLTTSQFIPIFTEQILINYILLRETGIKPVEINVGTDGSMQWGGGKLLRCPAVIPSKKVQQEIMKNIIYAQKQYEDGSISEVALLQAKTLNRYNEKKALLKNF